MGLGEQPKEIYSNNIVTMEEYNIGSVNATNEGYLAEDNSMIAKTLKKRSNINVADNTAGKQKN